MIEKTASTIAPSQLKERVELGARGVLTIVGLAYVAGLLITNLYVGLLGFSPPELAQPRYVVVGFLWLFLIVLTYALGGTCFYSARAVRDFWRRRNNVAAVTGLTVAAAMPFVGVAVLFVVSEFELTINDKKTWMVLAILALTAFSFHPAYENVAKLWTWWGESERAPSPGPYLNAQNVLTHIGLWMLLVAGYATLAYPRLPAALGGGKTASVILLSSKEGSTQLSKLGIPLRKDGLLGPVYIVYEDDHYYYIIIGSTSKRGVRVSKTLVDGAINQGTR